jgi:hypothetical protein
MGEAGLSSMRDMAQYSERARDPQIAGDRR